MKCLSLHCADIAQDHRWLSVRLRTKWLWVRVQLQSQMTLDILCEKQIQDKEAYPS